MTPSVAHTAAGTPGRTALRSVAELDQALSVMRVRATLLIEHGVDVHFVGFPNGNVGLVFDAGPIAAPAPAGPRHRGYVERFDLRLGIGFVLPDAGGELLVDVGDVIATRELREGHHVTFELSRTHHGRAVRVQRA